MMEVYAIETAEKHPVRTGHPLLPNHERSWSLAFMPISWRSQSANRERSTWLQLQSWFVLLKGCMMNSHDVSVLGDESVD